MSKLSTDASIEDPNLYGVAQFLKCPRCHRSTTTSLTIHPDGDVRIDCDACDAVAIGHKLHESDRTYE